MSRASRTVPCALALAVSLVGCSSAKTAAVAQFHTQDGFTVQSATEPCLLHQTDAPTKEFMGGPSASPALQLPFMAYLKANGNKAFCDGKPATDIDKKWAQEFVTQTGSADSVSFVTGILGTK